jgi:hypothetical protein
MVVDLFLPAGLIPKVYVHGAHITFYAKTERLLIN